MCRGCVFQSKDGNYENSDHTITDDYLEWLSLYQYIAKKMDELNSDLLRFKDKVPDKEHKSVIDHFRRKIIRTRKEYLQHESIINSVRE